MTWIPVNINVHARVQLTDQGRTMLAAWSGRPEDGYIQKLDMQLWRLMHIFGPAFKGAGTGGPFVDNRVEIASELD